MIENCIGIKRKSFIHNPKIILVYGAMFFCEIILYVLKPLAAQNLEYIVQYMPLLFVIAYIIVEMEEYSQRYIRMYNAYFHKWKIAYSNFIMFTIVTVLFILQMTVLAFFFAGHNDVYDIIPYMGIAIIMFLYTEFLYLMADLILYITNNIYISAVSVCICAYISNYIKMQYLCEISRMLLYTGIDEYIKKVKGDNSWIFSEKAIENSSITNICIAVVLLVILYSTILFIDRKAGNGGRK